MSKFEINNKVLIITEGLLVTGKIGVICNMDEDCYEVNFEEDEWSFKWLFSEEDLQLVSEMFFSEKDQEIFFDALMNPPKPGETLKDAIGEDFKFKNPRVESEEEENKRIMDEAKQRAKLVALRGKVEFVSDKELNGDDAMVEMVRKFRDSLTQEKSKLGKSEFVSDKDIEQLIKREQMEAREEAKQEIMKQQFAEAGGKDRSSLKQEEEKMVQISDEELKLLEEEIKHEKTKAKFDYLEGKDINTQEFITDLAVSISKIWEKDPEFANVLADLINYLKSTYSDKYEFSPMGNPSMEISKDPKLGKGANMFNAIKYLQRYCTEGFDKSNNPKDLIKSIHYIIFQLVNHNKNNG